MPTQEDEKPFFMLNVNPLDDVNNEENESVVSSVYKSFAIPEVINQSTQRSMANRSPNRSPNPS